MPPVAELASACESLIRDVAPELADVPVYVQPASQLALELMQCRTYGITWPRLSTLLRIELGERLARCRLGDGDQRYGDCHGGAAGAIAEFLGTALHEAAHGLMELPAILATRPMPAAETFLYYVMASEVGQERDEAVASPKSADDNYQAASRLGLQHAPDGHLRVLLHLRARAERLGVRVPCSCLMGPWWDCYPVAGYNALLADAGEYERLAGATVEQILREPLPPKYAADADEDRRRFLENLRQLRAAAVAVGPDHNSPKEDVES